MPTINLLPEATRLTMAVNNDKVLLAGPFSTRDPVTGETTVVSRTGRRLRFVLKEPEASDASALLDYNSEDNPTKVIGVGEPDDGVWAIDLRGDMPAAGFYAFRADIANEADPLADRETVGHGFIRVKAM